MRDHKMWEEIAYRFSIGTHGFPLPDIKTWNDFLKGIEEQINKEFVLKGTVDDLVNGVCDSCGSELIRGVVVSSPLFEGGIIYCPQTFALDSHPKDYWVEIWPDANWKPNERFIDRIGKDLKQAIIDRWKLSDPKIKKCFHPNDFLLYSLAESYRMEANPHYNPKKLPEPLFAHP